MSQLQTQTDVKTVRTGQDARPWGLMAEFDSPAAIMHAAEKIRDAGFRYWDTHTPFPVHGLDKAMGIKPTWLPIFVFFLGLTGTMTGIILQVFTNATAFDIWGLVWVRGYEFAVSGKPLISGQAFIPVIFELTILLSAVGCVLLMLLMNGLPRWYHPTFNSERFARVTDDKFFLVIESRDPQFQITRTRQLMESLHPTAIEEISD